MVNRTPLAHIKWALGIMSYRLHTNNIGGWLPVVKRNRVETLTPPDEPLTPSKITLLVHMDAIWMSLVA